MSVMNNFRFQTSSKWQNVLFDHAEMRKKFIRNLKWHIDYEISKKFVSLSSYLRQLASQRQFFVHNHDFLSAIDARNFFTFCSASIPSSLFIVCVIAKNPLAKMQIPRREIVYVFRFEKSWKTIKKHSSFN